MFFKISQNSQEKTCAKVSFLIKLQISLFTEYLWTTASKNNHAGLHCIEKCSYSEFFCLYSARMRENTDQKNSAYGHFSCSVIILLGGKVLRGLTGANYLISKVLTTLGDLFSQTTHFKIFHEFHGWNAVNSFKKNVIFFLREW